MDGVMLLRHAREAGLRVETEGDKLVIRGPRNAEPVARLLIEHKPEVMAALAPDVTDCAARTALLAGEVSPDTTTASWWCDFHADRLANHELGGKRAGAEAGRLAYGDCIVRWHRLFGRRWPTWQCPGCDAPIGGLSALSLADGTRVHFDDKLACILRYTLPVI
jgi:hypothetical protein